MSVIVRNVRRKGKGKSTTPRRQARLDPQPSALAYTGPLRYPRARVENDVYTMQINVANAVASNGAGLIATVFDSDNQLKASTDWSSFAALYNEYRTLSMEVELTPWNKYNLPTTTQAAPMYTVIDRNDNSALSSLSGTVNYDSVEAHQPSSRVLRAVKMDGPDEAEWISTANTPTSTARMYIKLYGAGNTASTTYYDYLNRLMVQFRGRK